MYRTIHLYEAQDSLDKIPLRKWKKVKSPIGNEQANSWFEGTKQLNLLAGQIPLFPMLET